MSVHWCSRAHVLACRAIVLVCSGALVHVSTAAQEHGTGALEHESTSAQVSSGVIAGRVLDVTGGQPLAGVTVSMMTAVVRPTGAAATSPPPPPRPGTLSPPVRVVTDSEGRFSFSGLPSGRFTLRVLHDGYTSVHGAAINLMDGAQVTDVVLEAGRHGVISGTVRDDGGDPIVGVGVRAFYKLIVGFRPSVLPRGDVLTDDRGQFRISNLPPGEYLICACVRDSLPIDKALLTRVGQDGIAASSVARQLNGAVLTFPPTFHPGNTRMADAVTVTVGYAEDRRGIDITMQPAAARRVSGKLVGGGPDASTAHTLALIRTDDDAAAIGTAELPAVRMTPEGGFDFAAVPPGKYTLEAFPSDGKKGLSASVAVTVRDADVTDVMVPLGPGATVRGRVEFSGAAPRLDGDALEKAVVTLVPIILTPAAMIKIGTSGSIGHSGTLSREGSFTIEGVLAGRYLVNASRFGPVWQTVESITTTDGRSLQPVLDVAPSGIDPLVVTLSDVTMSTLEVTLSLGKYEVPNEVRVAIFPVDRTFWSEPYLAPSRFNFSGAGSTGVISFPPLLPGDYYVIDMASAEAQLSPDFMAEWAKRATTVRLRAGEKTTVALKR